MNPRDTTGNTGRMSCFLRRELPYGLPLPRAAWVAVALAELGFFLCLAWLLAVCACLSTAMVRGHLEYLCGFHTWLAFAMLFLYPLALLCSPWRRLEGATRALLAGTGALCLLAPLLIAAAWSLNPEPLYCREGWLGGAGYTFTLRDSLTAFLPLPLLALDCILRWACSRRYGHCFYLGACIRAAADGRRHAWLLPAAALAGYTVPAIAYFVFLNAS